MPKRDLISIEDLSRADVELLLDTAESFLPVLERDIKKVPTLRGRTIINLFWEASTRTSSSFDLAAKRLSADTLGLKAKGSAVEKGETLKDTAITLSAYSPDIIVMRHPSAGACQTLSANTEASVINAGDGKHQHPTQCLLDLFSMRQNLGRDLDGLKVFIIGDILHSRVARSDIMGFQMLGMDVTLVAPPTLMPRGIEEMGVKVEYDLAEPQGRRRHLPAAHPAGAHQGGRQLPALAARVRRPVRHLARRVCGRGSGSCTPAPSTAASRSPRTSPTTTRTSSRTRSSAAWRCAWRSCTGRSSATATAPRAGRCCDGAHLVQARVPPPTCSSRAAASSTPRPASTPSSTSW